MILADYATGRTDRNVKSGERCATGGAGRSGWRNRVLVKDTTSLTLWTLD